MKLDTVNGFFPTDVFGGLTSARTTTFSVVAVFVMVTSTDLSGFSVSAAVSVLPGAVFTG